MSNRLEIKVDGDDVSADKMLKVATLTLRILKGIERNICKEQGVKPSTRWRVDMQSGHSYGLIAIRGESLAGPSVDARIWAVAQESVRRLAAGKPEEA